MKTRSSASLPDDTLTYVVEHPASDLPPVCRRDLLLAWDKARDAARHARWGPGRNIRFHHADGSWTTLGLQDRDAACWAGAVDQAMNLRTGYGLSVCLRLLALIELVARAPWARALVAFDRQDATVDPGLLRLAAEARLTDEARFGDHLEHLHAQALSSEGFPR